MLNRKIELALLKWKNSGIRKVLILRGARQVGKTSVVRKFGQEHFSDLIEINMENREIFEIFDKALSTKQFLERVELVFERKAIPGQTLLFIDEVQSSKNVMELLRFFAEDHPDLHVIVTGSLMEVVMRGKWNVPVGRVEYLNMYPLTFFEYLEAIDRNAVKKQLLTWRLGETKGHNLIWRELFEEYLQVGGMPEAVINFKSNHSYSELAQIHSRLSESYQDDIVKYVSKDKEASTVRMVLGYAPRIAGQMFTYENMGQSGLPSRNVSEAVAKVALARLLYQVPSINSTNLPITIKFKRPKKMIWCDIGLSNAQNKISVPLLQGTYSGQMMEQVVGQTLIADFEHEKPGLYYWGRDHNEGSAEVDFVMQRNQQLVAFEVKAGNSREMKSLFSMMDLGGDDVVPVRISWDEPGIETYEYASKKYKVYKIPFYLLERWQELVPPSLLFSHRQTGQL